MRRRAFYNEPDAFASRWLGRLEQAGHIAPGDIDVRQIQSLSSADLRDYGQAHFFAGIGSWSHALRLAGWPDGAAVWTGSPPCQPFSLAGPRTGKSDRRHLFPFWRGLIAQCRPAVIFGEQVASPAGRSWFDDVSASLEDLGYACAAADLCAAGIGAPHIRQRLFWVALADGERLAGLRLLLRKRQPQEEGSQAVRGRPFSGLGDTDGEYPGRVTRERDSSQVQGHRSRRGPGRGGNAAGASGTAGGTRDPGWQAGGELPVGGFWSPADLLACRDGSWRPVEPGSFPLAHGATARVGRLRGYGNSIVAPLAAEFIAEVMALIVDGVDDTLKEAV